MLRSIIGQAGNSSSISRVKLRQITVQLGKRAGFNNVGLFGSHHKAQFHTLKIDKEEIILPGLNLNANHPENLINFSRLHTTRIS